MKTILVTIIDTSDGFISQTASGSVYRESSSKLFADEDKALEYAYSEYVKFFKAFDFEDGKDEFGGTILTEDSFRVEMFRERGQVVINGYDSHVTVEVSEIEVPEPESIEVSTSAGIIRAEKSCDPGQPGISVTLQPDGYDYEIECAYVSVYEEKGYQTEDKEEPVDVVIMSYGDPYSEDCTRKDILRREDIVEALLPESGE